MKTRILSLNMPLSKHIMRTNLSRKKYILLGTTFLPVAPRHTRWIVSPLPKKKTELSRIMYDMWRGPSHVPLSDGGSVAAGPVLGWVAGIYVLRPLEWFRCVRVCCCYHYRLAPCLSSLPFLIWYNVLLISNTTEHFLLSEYFKSGKILYCRPNWTLSNSGTASSIYSWQNLQV